MTTQRDWQERLAHAVGRNLKRLREDRTPKLSAQSISNRTRELGHHIQRPVITNLENGRRASVTLGDLFVLAAALEVPPFALIAPLTSDEPIEFLPGRFASPWRALGWFGGETYVPSGANTATEEFSEWLRVLEAYEMRHRYNIALLLYSQALVDAGVAEDVERPALLAQLPVRRAHLEELRNALGRLGVTDIPNTADALGSLSTVLLDEGPSIEDEG